MSFGIDNVDGAPSRICGNPVPFVTEVDWGHNAREPWLRFAKTKTAASAW